VNRPLEPRFLVLGTLVIASAVVVWTQAPFHDSAGVESRLVLIVAVVAAYGGVDGYKPSAMGLCSPSYRRRSGSCGRARDAHPVGGRRTTPFGLGPGEPR
jgi:hypothetical protein